MILGLKLSLAALILSVWIVAADELKKRTHTRTLFGALAVLLAHVLP